MAGIWSSVLPTAGGRCRHLASAEGQLAASKWLLENDCSPNPVDRFLRTPLEVICPPVLQGLP